MSCWALKCTRSRSKDAGHGEVGFFKVPEGKIERETWKQALGFLVKANGAYLCTEHFNEDDIGKTETVNGYRFWRRIPDILPHNRPCRCIDTQSKVQKTICTKVRIFFKMLSSRFSCLLVMFLN